MSNLEALFLRHINIFIIIHLNHMHIFTDEMVLVDAGSWSNLRSAFSFVHRHSSNMQSSLASMATFKGTFTVAVVLVMIFDLPEAMILDPTETCFACCFEGWHDEYRIDGVWGVGAC